jgi:hypothetical protein
MRAGRAMLRGVARSLSSFHFSVSFALRLPSEAANPERCLSYLIVAPGELGQKDVK